VAWTSLGLVLGFYLRGGSPTALAGGATCSSQNGDVNASGAVDLSDAVTILGNLFLGSPAVLAPLCSTRGLPDTGQTACYSGTGAGGALSCGDLFPLACPAAGQDAVVHSGCPNDANRFTDHGNGTVTDNCTGLMWQKESADVNDDGNIDDLDRVTWCEAMVFCANLTFGGHNDWRLPNVRELQSIVNYGEGGPIDPLFRLAPGDVFLLYLTSTTYATTPSAAWMVDFRATPGAVGIVSKGNDNLFRAVRDAP
jgi:hypothetical protein